MSLPGTSFSVSVSQRSNVSSFQTILAFLRASEYWKPSSDAEVSPYTPPRRGPSLSRSNAWHPPQRFSNSALPFAWASTRAGLKRLDPMVSIANPVAIAVRMRGSSCRRIGLRSCQRGIHHGQAVLFHNRFHVGDPEHAAQFVVRDLHRATSLGHARLGLREGRGHRGVERNATFHLLHDLVDVTVHDGDSSAALEE